jgi:hypothetical protein
MRFLRSQLEQLGRRSARAFAKRIAAFLRGAYPTETHGMSDEALDAWTQRNVERAAARGVDTEPEVAQYLLLCLLLGEDAPERLPWFRAPLADPALLAPGKVRALVRAARAESVPELDRFVMESFAA